MTHASPVHLLRPADDDGVLVERVRNGDSTAFALLFEQLYSALCQFAYAYVGSRAVAEEVVQDVFCAVWQQHARWTVHHSTREYFYGAVRNRAFRVRRRERFETAWVEREGTDSELLQMTSRTELGDAELMAGELNAVIRQAISALPPRCRETFILSRQHRLSTAEIAAAMGTTPKTVEIQLGKALRALRHAVGNAKP